MQPQKSFSEPKRGSTGPAGVDRQSSSRRDTHSEPGGPSSNHHSPSMYENARLDLTRLGAVFGQLGRSVLSANGGRERESSISTTAAAAADYTNATAHPTLPAPPRSSASARSNRGSRWAPNGRSTGGSAADLDMDSIAAIFLFESPVAGANAKFQTSVVDLWALGITIVIGGQYFGWNEGLYAGFGSFAIATLLIGSAYTCLCLCTSELASTLPFAGGAYGLARVTLGFYFGYLIGFCETCAYITYVATSVLSLSRMVMIVTGSDHNLEPLFHFLFYISALFVYNVMGRQQKIYFWRFNLMIGLLSFLILVIFILGAAKYASFNKYAGYNSSSASSYKSGRDGDPTGTERQWFIGGMMGFMHVLPLASWFYVGVESLSFACDEIDAPKKKIPMGYLSCMATLALTSIGVLFVACSLEPEEGDLPFSDETAPLNKGFRRIFGISDRMATIFSIPATYATALGFIFSYGKLISAMAGSGLIFAPLKRLPVAYFTGSVISFLVCLIVHFVPYVKEYLFNICMLSAFGTYLSQFCGFIALRTRFSSLNRDFRSPLGISGAVFGGIVFSIAAVGVIAFQDDNQVALISFICLLAMQSAYYFFYAKRFEKFSPEESKLLFVAHVMQRGKHIIPGGADDHTHTLGDRLGHFFHFGHHRAAAESAGVRNDSSVVVELGGGDDSVGYDSAQLDASVDLPPGLGRLPLDSSAHMDGSIHLGSSVHMDPSIPTAADDSTTAAANSSIPAMNPPPSASSTKSVHTPMFLIGHDGDTLVSSTGAEGDTLPIASRTYSVTL